MSEIQANIERENEHWTAPPEDLAACPHADDFGSPR